MERFTNFLETSTIHGLAYIATAKKYVRLFWIVVVIAGFTGAGVIIYQSFESWADSPVKTTIETKAITEINFPKVTVCPPKNTYTDLNYDLMTTENMTLDNDTRNELANYAVEMLYDHLYDNIMRNMSKMEESNRYQNWYHGYTEIKLPYIGTYSFCPGCVYYYVDTAAISGSISTPNFGDEFDAEKVEQLFYCKVSVYPPASVIYNSNVTLHIDVEKVSLNDLSKGGDRLGVDGTTVKWMSSHTYNFSPPTGGYYGRFYIDLTREVLPEDVMKQKLNLMPGFRYTWHYSGIEVEPEDKYRNYRATQAFVRKGSIAYIRFPYIISREAFKKLQKNT